MKLLNINIGIKIDNAKQVAEYIKSQDAEFVAIQEVARPLENSVLSQYRSKEIIEEIIGSKYPYSFFGPLWVTHEVFVKGKMEQQFGGQIEQGNQMLSKYRFTKSINLYYYKEFSYMIDWSNWKEEDHGRALLISEYEIGGKRLQILNVHGIWTKDKKGDDRTIKECEFIVEEARKNQIPTIISGDFNLHPETESIQIINKEFINLIDEYDIKNTRPNIDDGTDKGNNVVDYIFVSDGIEVKDFAVDNTDISDHLPLILDFEIK